MFGLDQFGFRELWSPIFMLVMIIIAALYLLAVGPYRTSFKNSEPVSKGRIITFLAGLFLYYLAQGGPIDLFGHLMFSGHMLSMSISYLVVPPLILLGTPAWLIKPVVMHKKIYPIFQILTKPILTLLMFNMLFSIYHIPMVHDYVMTHYFVHFLYYLALLFAAFLMYWNVISPIPEMDRLTDVKKMGYIFANGVLLTPACALIIFAGSPVYATYSDPNVWAVALGYCIPQNPTFILENFQGPENFMLIDTLEDQQLGGIIMKLMQEFTYGTILFIVFLRWYSRENPTVVDPIH